MNKTTLKVANRVAAMRKAGLTFREIERRTPKALGLKAGGNGTKAFRLLERLTDLAVDATVATEMDATVAA